MIIIDENIEQLLVQILKDYTDNVISIREDYPGITDREVIKVAESNRGLVITEDKDFGELIFSYNILGCSVILLRFSKGAYFTLA